MPWLRNKNNLQCKYRYTCDMSNYLVLHVIFYSISPVLNFKSNNSSFLLIFINQTIFCGNYDVIYQRFSEKLCYYLIKYNVYLYILENVNVIMQINKLIKILLQTGSHLLFMDIIIYSIRSEMKLLPEWTIFPGLYWSTNGT